MSTRAAPDVEAQFRLQGQIRKLDEIEAALQQRRFSMIDHPIVQNAAADVPRAVAMLLTNARATPYGNLDCFEALTKISQKYPDSAVSVVEGIAGIGGLEAANALKDFPRARSDADAEAYISAVTKAKDGFPVRTAELVLSAFARKNPNVGTKVISALVELDTDFGVVEAISLTYDNAERTAHLLPLLAAKPGYELPVVSLHVRDTQEHLPFRAYVDALINFKTDTAADCLSGLALANKRMDNRAIAVEGLEKIGSDHAAELLSGLAVSEKDLRLPAVTSLFVLREQAVQRGRNDLEIFDTGLRRAMNTALNMDEINRMVSQNEVSEFSAAFRKADKLKLGRGSDTYTGLFSKGVDLVHQQRRFSEKLTAFTRAP